MLVKKLDPKKHFTRKKFDLGNGDWVFIRAMSAPELIALRESMPKGKKSTDASLMDMCYRMLAEVLVDDNGNKIVDDPKELEALDLGLFRSLCEAAFETAGLKKTN